MNALEPVLLKIPLHRQLTNLGVKLFYFSMIFLASRASFPVKVSSLPLMA